MGFILQISRITALIIWSVLIGLWSVPYQLGGKWKDIRKISRIVRAWNRGAAWIVGLQVTVRGKLPSVSGGLVVSNHLGYIDILTHGSVLPLRYTPKSDIAKWPVLGWYIGLSRPIWIDRESKQSSQKSLRDFAKTMKQGMYLIVYPEGTSTDGKSGILPFKSTPFEAAITGDAPIIPVLTRYIEAPGEPTVAWYGDMTLLPHIWRTLRRRTIKAELRFLEPIYPENRSRKELAAFVHGVMQREYSGYNIDQTSRP